ncbi:hypothetical protein ACGC1H_000967 [Rhizoctonia solani]
MAALVSEGWGAARELDPFGGEFDGYRPRQLNRRPRSIPIPYGAPHSGNLWLGGQNDVATGGTNANPPPTNTNNPRNTRNRNNASQTTQNNTLQQNPAGQPPPQGRNRNRNRNRNANANGNRNAQQTAGPSDTPNGQAGPSRGRGQNNRGPRSNASNADASNLTPDPITGELISKRAAKRRRAKARKAAGETTVTRPQQPRNPPRPPVVRSGAPVNRPTAASTTQPLSIAAATVSAPPVPSVPQVGRNPILASPQPQPIVTTTAQPNATTNTTNNGAALSTSRLSAHNETSGRTSPREDTLRRWRHFLNDTPQTVRSNPVASSSNPPVRLGAPARPAPVVPPVPLANRNVGLAPPARAGAAGAPPIIPPVSPNLVAFWDSDDENDPPIRARPVRNIRELVAPARVPAPLNPLRVPVRPVVRPAPRRIRPTTACLVCLDIPDEFPRNLPTAHCTHPVTICAPCLEQHISHAVLSQGLTSITCPHPTCRQNMEYSDVIRGTKTAKACQDRYESLLLRRTLEAEPNFVWCKNANCNWGQVHESGANAPIVICQVCRSRSCFTHNVPWHTGLTCAQYSAQNAHRERENAASEAYITQHAKQCPNSSCGRRIEKNDGCDHMTCRRPAGCGHEFCWVCLADYRPILRDGNHHHNPTCLHYAPIRPVTTLEDLLRQRQYVPIARPNIPVRPRLDAMPPRPPAPAPQPQPRPPPARAPAAPASGSFLGWVFGAAVAFIAGT